MWGIAPYWIPAVAAVIVLVVLALASRSRASKRSRRRRPVSSSSVDPFYLDSSHAGEPQTDAGGAPGSGGGR